MEMIPIKIFDLNVRKLSPSNINMNIAISTIVYAEKELLSAMKEGNIDMLDTLLHEDLLFNIPTGQTITKDMDLANYRSGGMKIDEITASDQEISLIDNVAIVSVLVEMKGTYIDHSLDGKYKIIRVWKLVGSQLKVIAGSSMILYEA